MPTLTSVTHEQHQPFRTISSTNIVVAIQFQKDIKLWQICCISGQNGAKFMASVVHEMPQELQDENIKLNSKGISF